MKHSRAVFSFFVAAILLSGAFLAPRAQAQTPSADSFNPAPDYYVHALALQRNGQVLAGGEFMSLGGQWLYYLGRLNTDGSLDASFNPAANGYGYCFSVQPDGRILVGGRFHTLGGQSYPAIGRLNADGRPDTSFNPGASGPDNSVFCMALQADGKVLAGGSFVALGAQNCVNFGRLNADGTLDTGFSSGANGIVYSLALQPDGQILVGGSFTTLGGGGCTNFGRLNADGSLDAGFRLGADGNVYSLAVQADGKILVGGRFNSLGGQSCTNFGRLNPNGSLDGSFNPRADSLIYSLAVQADGKIIAGGGFGTLGGQPCNYLGRLNADGSLDTTFGPGVNGAVLGVALQAGGEVVVSGYFGTLGGQSRKYLGRVNKTDLATINLSFDGSTATWLRGGASHEVWRATLEVSTNATDWVSLGAGQRIAGGWQWSGVSSPTNVNLRARGFATGGQYNGSGWFVETGTGLPITITSQPVSRTNNAATMATFSVRADGIAPYAYQWRKEGLDLRDGGNITGATGPTLTLSNVVWADAGAYSAVASQFSGSVTSAVATLSVVDPFILTQPATQTRNAGESAVFTLTVAGTPVLNYQWYRDGAAVDGATSTSLTLTNVQAADGGSVFQAVAANSVGSVTSAVVYLTVNVVTPDSFNPGANSDAVRCLALQADGKVLAGGGFTSLGGQARNRLGRLNADGSLDATFSLVADNTIYALAIQADSRILAAGDFLNLGAASRSYLGRFDVDGTVDSTFNPGANGGIRALALQADGRILVGGSFTTLSSHSRTNLGRLNADGSLDTGFSAGANGAVYSLAMQPDGRILVAGGFTLLSGQSCTNLGRLNADGGLDTNFISGANGAVYSLTMQADGRILAGGSFTTLSGQSCTNLGRLNADGSLDTSFNPGPRSPVYSLAVQADGKILVGGDFTTLGGQRRTYIGRLNADGTVDMTFDPGANSSTYALGLQADGMILAGGSFTTLGGQSRSRIGRLYNPPAATNSLSFDGSTITWGRGATAPEVWRTTFEGSTNNADWTSLGAGQRVPGGWALSGLSFPTNGTLRARGFVTGGQYNGTSWYVESSMGPPAVTRQPVGVKTLTNMPATFSVAAIGSTPFVYQWYKDGSALGNATNSIFTIPSLAGSDAGNYWVVISNEFGAVTSSAAVLTLLPASAPDSFNPGADGAIYTLVPQVDGKVLVGGSFATLGGQPRADLGRLNADGSVDASFNPGAGGTVYTLALQADGKILVGGNFGTLGGASRVCVGRLNADGSVDATFNPGADGNVYSIALQSDGKIVLGGDFYTLAGQGHEGIGRLNTDGSLDASFTPSVYRVLCVAIQPDGKILAGSFGNGLCRFNPDGTGDAGFQGASGIGAGAIRCLAVQRDGKILVGTTGGLGRLNANGSGDSLFNPGANNAVYSLGIQTDGKVLVGGNFTTLGGRTRNYLGRLTAEGTLDPTFGPEADSTVWAQALQADGGVLVGGGFTTVGGQPRRGIGRLSNTEPVIDSLFGDGSAITWLRGATAPEVWRATIVASTNATDWISLGEGQRAAGGWQWNGWGLPANASLWARGFVTGGEYNGSRWFVEASFGPPFITRQPASLRSPTNTLATLSAVANGSSPLGYQWYKEGLAVSDATNAVFSIPSLGWSDAGNYRVVITNTFGSLTSAVAILSIPDPLISTQPSNTTNAGGTVATLSVVAVGTAPLKYQWWKNGAVLSGATAASLTFTNVAASDGASYYAVVTNSLGSATSQVATLTVIFCTPDSFSPLTYAPVDAVAVQPDGGILVGGLFTSLNSYGRSYLGRFNADGSLDQGFNPGAGNAVFCLAIQEDSKIVVGGQFATLGGQSRTNVGRLNADGTLDSSFNSRADGVIESMLVQADGKILLGGGFSNLIGQSHPFIGRLKASGAIDSTFSASASGHVEALAVQQSDGQILVGGSFTSLNATPRNYIGRLSSSGALDITFNPGANGAVFCLVVQPEGNILVGGSFTSLGGQNRTNIGRLTSTGAVDTTFNPGADGAVYSMALQVNGKIIVGGAFTKLGGASCTRLGRLRADGSFDPSLNPGVDGVVRGLAEQPDGKVLVAGDFLSLAGQYVGYLRRLQNTDTATQSLVWDGSSLTWNRGGASPEVWRVVFENWAGTNWSNLGQATRIAGGWQRAGLSLPTNATLRARGFISGGRYNASGSVAETLIGPPAITSQPLSRTNSAGTTAAFGVSAVGVGPLTYQWQFNGTNLTDGGKISGAATAQLSVTNVSLSDSGSYVVVVSNTFGSVTSSPAVLSVSFRGLLVQATNSMSGNTLTVPVTLVSDNGENAIAFSVTFDTNLLSLVDVTNGPGILDGVLSVNTSQAAQGRVGISVVRPLGATYSAGSDDLAWVRFATVMLTNSRTTTVDFSDQPVARSVKDASGAPLLTRYLSGAELVWVPATNQAPVVTFTRTPTNATTMTVIAFDASGTTDDMDSNTQLQYQWDWENDGVFDTPFTNVLTTSHRYSVAGTKTVTLQVKDRYGKVGTTSQTFVVAPENDPGVPGGGNVPFQVPFTAADVAFDPVRPLAYVSGYANKTLVVVNLTNGLIERQFSFDWMPDSISVSPSGDKMCVALVLRPHDWYWFGSSGYIAEFDLTAQVMTRVFPIGVDPYDVAVADSGIVFAPGGSGQWTSLLSYQATTGQLLGTSSQIRQSRVGLHPSQQAVYLAQVEGQSPSSTIIRCSFDPATGGFVSRWQVSYTGSYHSGSYYYVGNIWCHPSGNSAFVKGGEVYTCSAVQAQDLQYRCSLAGADPALGGGLIEGVSFDQQHGALFTVGVGKLWYYNLDSYELVGNRVLDLDARYVKAAGSDIFLAGPAGDHMVFERVANPAVGAESNQPPVAVFARTPTNETRLATILFDASASSDDEDSTAQLQYRWDWENDGTFDTAWTHQPTALHRYPLAGTRTAGLQVKDRHGAVTTVTQTFDVLEGEDPGTPGGGTAAFEVPFEAADVAFDPVRPYAYVTGFSNRTVAVFNLTNGLVERQFVFDWMPESIAVSPNGQMLYVALLRLPHGSSLYGPYTNYIAEFDLARQANTRVFQVLADPCDLEVTDGGILLMSGGSGNAYTDLQAYQTATGQRLAAVGSIPVGSPIALHPSQRYVYVAPYSVYKWEISGAGGVLDQSWWWPAQSGRIFCPPSGTNVIGASGGIFTSSEVPAADMLPVGTLAGGTVAAVAFDQADHALFTLGSSNLWYYNLDSWGLFSSQPVNSGASWVGVLGPSVFVAGVSGDRTFFQRIGNPAVATLQIVQEPSSQSVVLGGTGRFAVASSGALPLTYQWLKDGVSLLNGTNVIGATTASLTLSNVSHADMGGYSVIVSNGFGMVTSAVASLTIVDPFIVTQPLGQWVDLGQAFTLSVGAGGTSPWSYQWRRNGTALAGAIKSSFTLTNAQLPNAGSYDVVVSNRYGLATSVAATLNVNPAVPDSLNPNANGEVDALAVLPDNRILIGGAFTSMAGQARNYLARLNADGSLDTTYNPGANGAVSCFVVQPDGKVLVGGSFSTLGGQAYNCIGRLNADGSADTSFIDPLANSTVNALLVQTDGKIVVGGTFYTICGVARSRLARLNADGTLDASFTPEADPDVYALALQPDGRILVGGSFFGVGGYSRMHMARLNPDGTVDASFDPSPYSTVYTIALQADGKILVGGIFSSIAGRTRNYLARLNPDGSLDLNFVPNPGSYVYTLAIQADGKILAAGNFTTMGGQSASRIARVNSDGGVDRSFNPGANNVVTSLLLHRDGGILVGGSFTYLDSQARNRVGRLCNTEPATQSLTFDGSVVTWLRGGTSPEGWLATFEHSLNGTTWTNLGRGTRISGGWQLANVALPPAGQLRARAYFASGRYNGSSGITETILVAPAITVQPAPQAVIPDGAAVFGVSATGTAPLSYQWLFDGVPLVNGSPITGATNALLTVSNVSPIVEGNYSVVVSNAYCAVTSSVALLRITPRAIVLVGTNAAPGGAVSVPVQLVSDDGEHSLTFSVAYDTNILSFVSATNGAGAMDATFTSTAGAGQIGISLARPAGVSFANGLYEVALLNFNVANISNSTVTALTFADAPTSRVVKTTNNLALPAAYNAGGVAITPFGSVTPSGYSSLFRQIVRVTNPPNAGGPVAAVRVWFYDLGVDSKGYAIRVYNAMGTSNGVPFILWNGPLAAGHSVDLTVEYYIADRTTMPHPRIVVEFPGAQTFTVPDGTALSVTFQIINGNGVVQFSTLAGHTYYVQYADDAPGAGGWRTAWPAVPGTGGTIQWIDSGPPKTESAPSAVPSRFYRVLLAP